MLIPADREPNQYAPGDSLTLSLRLFGDSHRYLPYLIHGLQRAGDSGLGHSHGRALLIGLDQQTLDGQWRTVYLPGNSQLDAHPPQTPSLPACPSQICINLITPLRHRRQERLVGPRDFTFIDLFGPLLRRLSLVSYFHSNTPLEVDFSGLMNAARQVPLLAASLHWHEWARYSSRQESLIQMGGLVGEIILEGAKIAPFWPYLNLGQYFHVGKGAVMGLGQYTLEPVHPVS